MSAPSLRCKLRGDPYAVLGLDRTADDRKIRAAYYREARRWHPDKQQNPEKLAQSTARFQQVQHAYEQILCTSRTDSAKATKQNCKAAAPGAWPKSSGNCHGSARAPPEPRPDPEPCSGRGAPRFAEAAGTSEERRWRQAEAQMQQEAEEVMGRSAEYAEEVLRRRYEQQKASLQELLKQAQERKRREGEAMNEKLRDWSRKQKEFEGAPGAPKGSEAKGPEPPSESKDFAGRGPLSQSQECSEVPEATKGTISEAATGGPLPRGVLDPTKAARKDLGECQGCCEDFTGDIPATPISRRRRSRRTESQGSRRRRRGHRGQEAQKVAAGPLPRPHSVEASGRSSQQGPVDKDEAPAAAIVLEGLRPAVWRWYLLFRLLLLLRDRGRAKAQLGGAVRRLASQWSRLVEGLLRRSRGPLEERARLARRECVLEQWASLCAALQGRARSQEHLRKSAQDRIRASLASHLSELSLLNGPHSDG